MAKRTPAERAARAARRARVLRGLALGALALGLAAAWVWQRTLPLRSVEVAGAVLADSAAVAARVGLPVGTTALFAVDPADVARRAMAEPWVDTVRVRRLPSGVLEVRLSERVPVALALDAAGRPAHFLDAVGRALPLAAGATFDVPLVTGAAAQAAPGETVASPGLRELLAALGAADETTAALVGEVAWTRAGVTLWTTAAGGHGSVPVRLARTGHADALARLRAFWSQSVLPRPATRFESVDLRFGGQVVTREIAPGDSLAAAPAAAPAAPRPL